MKYKNLLFSALKLILLLIVFYFVYKHFNQSWTELKSYDWNLDILLLLASILLHFVTFIMFSKVWCILIEAFGFKVKLSHAFKIAYITSLGRYLPGKLWPVIGMSYLAKQLDINEESAVASWVIALIFTLPSAFLASFICILIEPEVFTDILNQYLDWTIYLMATIVFCVSVVLIVKPNLIFSIINIILTKIKRPIINLNLNYKTALKIYFGYFLCWLLFGFSFLIFILSISSTSNIPMIPSIGAFIIAYQLGYLAFFAPGGIGVRELVLTTILVPFLGPIAASVSIAARLWNMTTEIIAALICTLIKFPKK